MQEAGVSFLTTWQNFYVIIGSAAATLTGLVFVVITLLAGVRGRRSSGGGDCSIQHAHRRAFWGRAAGRRASQRALAGALACCSASRVSGG
jgi:hypothetical protein